MWSFQVNYRDEKQSKGELLSAAYDQREWKWKSHQGSQFRYTGLLKLLPKKKSGNNQVIDKKDKVKTSQSSSFKG